jgi:hypothetical protein
MTRGNQLRFLPALLFALALAAAGCGDKGGGGQDNDGGPPPDGTAGDGTTVDGSPEADGAVVTPELNCDPINCGTAGGSTVPVNSGGDLQAALDSASPGDTLVLEAGATFTGNFVLPNKTGTGCIVVRTSTQDSNLPEGVRVTPADASKLARVVTPGNGLPALRTETRAHNYHLIGLEIMPESPTSEVYDLISLGGGSSVQTTLDEVPRDIIIDRCFIHAWPDANFKRGIGLNSAHTCIISSHISDFHSDFQDSQAIGGYNGPGPFRIINNRLEGGAENIMFGGGVPSINGLVPEDIIIRGNHFFKPLVWKADDPGNTGYTPWVKNLFEIKNGRNVTLEGNLLENNWVGADQHGFAVVLTPRSEGGAVPWAVVERVRIRSNIFRHVGGGVAILGQDTGGSSQQTNQIYIENNLFEDIRQDYALDIVRVIQFTGTAGVTANHNTFVYAPGSWPMLRGYGDQTTNFVYTNNIIEYREGFWADCGTDNQAIACITPGAVFEGNVIIGGPQANFPAGNFFPAALGDVGFVDYANGASDYHNYGLAASSAYAGAGTDGTDPGFDPAAVDVARGIAAP